MATKTARMFETRIDLDAERREKLVALLNARLADMDRDGVAKQALSPMPELFSYWAPPADGGIWASSLNRWIAEACSTAPDRFVGLGTVPMQDVGAALE